MSQLPSMFSSVKMKSSAHVSKYEAYINNVFHLIYYSSNGARDVSIIKIYFSITCTQEIGNTGFTDQIWFSRQNPSSCKNNLCCAFRYDRL